MINNYFKVFHCMFSIMNDKLFDIHYFTLVNKKFHMQRIHYNYLQNKQYNEFNLKLKFKQLIFNHKNNGILCT